ncbi:SulP family inorganic anion transporter [Lewinella sp. JB7]|uniref:SulP family inorganic anion transporter n=1 Tax=Lewinella sp. JB7 TaxID=2962887 RepID=UPI0020CA162B|nr:solute carrier family 26 protein [Lewinella sp. JB7]MCP9236677.1 solute carrier family 26 protein [Lewinella sp. JB7]
MHRSMRFFLPSWVVEYRRDWLGGDVSAGLTVGVMLIPQGMAYAMLAGLPPVHGLYAATLPILAYALLGTSRQLAVGPVAMDSLLTAATLGALAVVGSENYLALAALLALLVGIVQLLAGVLRFGFVVDLLSRPIISGFTSAAAIIIGMSQLKHLLGIDTGNSAYVHELLLATLREVDNINWLAVGVGGLGIALIIAAKRIDPRIPGPLLAVMAGILLTWGLGLTDYGLRIVGGIPGGLPPLALPALGWEEVRQLIPAALTISLVGFMESIAVAKAVRNRHADYELDANREMLGLGAANVAVAVVRGYPVTGGFSRTAVNDQSGAKSGLAGIISAGVIVLTLLFLTPLFYYLPNAILAAIILVAVAKLINPGEAKRLWRVDRADFWMLVVTFFATLIVGIQLGIGIGVVLSVGVHLYRSMRPHLAVLGRIPGTDNFRNVARFPHLQRVPGTLIVRFDGPLYFANLTYFQQQLRQRIEEEPGLDAVVINAEGIGSLDSSALYELEQFVAEQRDRGVKVRFAGVIGPVRDRLKRAGLTETIGQENFFVDVASAVAANRPTDYALQSNE